MSTAPVMYYSSQPRTYSSNAHYVTKHRNFLHTLNKKRRRAIGGSAPAIIIRRRRGGGFLGDGDTVQPTWVSNLKVPLDKGFVNLRTKCFVPLVSNAKA